MKLKSLFNCFYSICLALYVTNTLVSGPIMIKKTAVVFCLLLMVISWKTILKWLILHRGHVLIQHPIKAFSILMTEQCFWGPTRSHWLLYKNTLLIDFAETGSDLLEKNVSWFFFPQMFPQLSCLNYCWLTDSFTCCWINCYLYAAVI